jgi:hypothetical protein
VLPAAPLWTSPNECLAWLYLAWFGRNAFAETVGDDWAMYSPCIRAKLDPPPPRPTSLIAAFRGATQLSQFPSVYTYALCQRIVRDRRHLRKQNKIFIYLIAAWPRTISTAQLLVWGGAALGEKTPLQPSRKMTFSSDRRFKKFTGSVGCAHTPYLTRSASGLIK